MSLVPRTCERPATNTTLLLTCTSDITDYAPIAKALHNLYGDAELKVKQWFDIAYLLGKHNLAFTKMEPLCKLEERHGVDLGQGYKNDQVCVSTLRVTFTFELN